MLLYSLRGTATSQGRSAFRIIGIEPVRIWYTRTLAFGLHEPKRANSMTIDGAPGSNFRCN